MSSTRWRQSIAVLVVAVLVATVWAAGETLSVQVASGKLRATPSYLGKIVGEEPYTAQVQVVESRGPWLLVTTSAGVTGWMHISSLTEKKLTLKSGTRDVAGGATGDEVALAGKGFTAQVEQQYQDQTGLDFSWVDRMEEMSVSPEESAAFLAAGQVVPREGGVR